MRSDTPAMIKPLWQAAFTSDSIKGAFRVAGISPLSGLSAVPKEKLPPSLSVMAAAGNPSVHIASLIEGNALVPASVSAVVKSCLSMHKPPLSEVERLRIENRELKKALSALKVVESLYPEQIGKGVKRGVPEKEHRRRVVVKAPGAQHATADDWRKKTESRSRRDWKWSKEQKHEKCLGQKGQAGKSQGSNAVLYLKVVKEWGSSVPLCAWQMLMACFIASATVHALLQLLICCLFTFCNLDRRTCLRMRIWTKLLRVHIVLSCIVSPFGDNKKGSVTKW